MPKKTPQNGDNYTAVLVEGLRSDFKLVIEKVDGLEESLVQRMDEKFAAHDERFDRIEAVLKDHSRMLQKNEERWKESEVRWNQNEERWNQNEVRWNWNDDRWKGNNERSSLTDSSLKRIENKLDRVIEKVERHDQELQGIRAKIVH